MDIAAGAVLGGALSYSNAEGSLFVPIEPISIIPLPNSLYIYLPSTPLDAGLGASCPRPCPRPRPRPRPRDCNPPPSDPLGLPLPRTTLGSCNSLGTGVTMWEEVPLFGLIIHQCGCISTA